MLFLSFLLLLVLSLGQWLFTPLLRLLTPLLSLAWLAWLGLAVVLWLFSGAPSDAPTRKPKL